MDIFIIFSFGFFLGLGIGIVTGVSQREENELENFKKKYDL